MPPAPLSDRLAARLPIEQPVALVVAHPDDETLAAGGSLHLFRRLLLVHVTDGAPLGLDDAAREGFATPADYAAARERELQAALALSGASPRRVSLGIADQSATDHVPAITAHLRALGVATVLTHAYEGGHPDHDAVALAVSRLHVETYEFAGYHAQDGDFTTGFLGEGCPQEVQLSAPDLARKRAMLACFHTQRDILSRFDPAIERFRPAPRHDFTKPPHSGPLLYERWGWMTGSEWRDRCG